MGLELGLLALLLLLKRPAPPQQQEATPTQAGPGPKPAAPSPGGGINAADVVGGIGSAAGAIGAVVGAVKGVAAIGGGAAVTGAGTSAATGGGAAATGAGTTAATGAGVSGAVVAANVGIGALILAIEIVIAYGVLMLTETAGAWQKWTGSSPLRRCAGLWFNDEQNTVESMVDPPSAGIVDPKTGKAPVSFVGIEQDSRVYVKEIDGFVVATHVPVASKIRLPAAEVTRLYRAARYLAIEKIRAYNDSQFWFFANGWNESAPRNPRGVLPAEFDAWVQEILKEEPWAEQLTWRGSCGLGQLEAAARSLFAPHFEMVRAHWRFRGRVMALTDCAITGYPFTGVWPGDETFSRTVVRFANLGGAPMGANLGGTWSVDEYWVNGGRKWVAVDPVTHNGFDIQGSRGAHSAVCYTPEQLKLDRVFPTEPKFSPQSAWADDGTIGPPAPARPTLASSGKMESAFYGSFKA